MEIEIRLIAVLVAALAGMMLGAFWYSPVAFGKAWMDSIGKSEEELGSATGPMIQSGYRVIYAIVMGAIIAGWPA